MDPHRLGQTDRHNRWWHVAERKDGTVYIYYTRPGNACHFIVWDEKDFPAPPKMRLPAVMSPSEIPLYNKQAEEDV